MVHCTAQRFWVAVRTVLSDEVKVAGPYLASVRTERKRCFIGLRPVAAEMEHNRMADCSMSTVPFTAQHTLVVVAIPVWGPFTASHAAAQSAFCTRFGELRMGSTPRL